MKQKKEIIALAVLLVIAAAVWVWNSRSNPAVRGAASFQQSFSALAVENPALHWPKLQASRGTQYKSSGRNPFSEVAPPPPPPLTSPSKPARAPQPGDSDYVAPPLQLPVKFFGYGVVPLGTERLAFLTDGDQVYVVGEGETLMGRYRILKVGNANLDFEEISTGRRGTATLEDQTAGG